MFQETTWSNMNFISKYLKNVAIDWFILHLTFPAGGYHSYVWSRTGAIDMSSLLV